MTNLHITYVYPWLLLLLVPALALTLIPYFRLSRKYRRTRNRITSIVLHLLVSFFAVSALAGMKFEYQIPNEKNEIIVLVDVSDTEERSAAARDEYLEDLLERCRHGGYRVGLVTFGYGCDYTVPLTTDVNSIFDRYNAAEFPDKSATDLETALVFAKDLFENPGTGRVVVITDGKETDGNALSVVRSLTASGIKVDAAYVPSDYRDGANGAGEAQITGITLPDGHINVGDIVSISVEIFSDFEGTAAISLYDNDALIETKTDVALGLGVNTSAFEYAFTEGEMHEVSFSIDVGQDAVPENNVYSSFVYLRAFNKVLVIERSEGESEKLREILAENEAFDADVINLASGAQLPATVDGLRMYDQIILDNINNSDLTDDFVDMLETYVNEYGGGLFTVGGDEDPDDPSSDPHGYSRLDLYNTKLQRMLPVSAIDYTPPLAVIAVIDTSGSMAEVVGGSGMSRLDWAREGCVSLLNAMSERDYFGLMTLDSGYNTVLGLTPRSQESRILAKIDSLEDANGGTVFPDAIDRAGSALKAQKDVAKRHIIIVTDGEVPEDQCEQYERYIKDYHDNDGITLSVVMINTGNAEARAQMQRAVDLGGGRLHTITSADTLVLEMREDLNVPEIKDVNYETFNPTVYSPLSILTRQLDKVTVVGDDGVERTTDQLDVTLDGFYGTKVKANAELILTGDYNVPLYAQWRYGEGMVGSFMCDLTGKWSADFVSSAVGRQFIRNAVANLMPMEDVRPQQIDIQIREDNYTNSVSVFEELEAGERITGRVIEKTPEGDVVTPLDAVTEIKQGEDPGCYVKVALGADNNYSRCSFVIKKQGIYTMVFEKISADGNVVASYETYKAFSYSEEYDVANEMTDDEARASLDAISARGGGNLVEAKEDNYVIFEDFITALDRIFDPTVLFAILSIILFLLDICVRKFKFKWIHEIVADYKEKKKGK